MNAAQSAAAALAEASTILREGAYGPREVLADAVANAALTLPDLGSQAFEILTRVASMVGAPRIHDDTIDRVADYVRRAEAAERELAELRIAYRGKVSFETDVALNDFFAHSRRQIAIAHNGLLRALDYRAATLDGLAIKDDVRDALKQSGYAGVLGTIGSAPAKIGDEGAQLPGAGLDITPGGHALIAERRRQIKSLGYTAAHDDDHGVFLLAAASASLAAAASAAPQGAEAAMGCAEAHWPEAWGDPEVKGPERDLIRAGALAIAALDVLYRAEERDAKETGSSHADD